MSLDTKQEIWLELARPVYPNKDDEEILAIGMLAAGGWHMKIEGPLTELYDQYVMLKTLKGIGVTDGNT